MCKFGDIYLANLPVVSGSCVQQGIRPVIVVSNDKNNIYSTMISVVPLTSKMSKHNLPTYVFIRGYGLSKPSIILAEQVRPLDKSDLLTHIGTIVDLPMRNKIQRAMMIQLNMVA